MISTFRSFLSEAVSVSKLDQVGELVASYMSRRGGGGKIFRYPGVEKFTNSNGSGLGIRFYNVKNLSSFRLNFESEGSIGTGSAALSSFDFWMPGGTNSGPDMNIEFDTSVSLVKTLPIIASTLQGKYKPGDEIYTAPDGVTLNESTEVIELLEARRAKGDPNQAYTELLDDFDSGNFAQSKFVKKWKSIGFKLVEEIKGRYPEFFGKDGRSVIFTGGDQGISFLNNERESILTAIGAVRATARSGGGSETYEPSPEVRELEDNAEKIAFEEQIEDLENLVRLTVAGTSNALFVAGRGGVGKTYNVEQTLASMGLYDGEGYFLNTGSVSAAGLYRLLFRYKDSLIVFDDADDVFKDQSSRNFLKNATDTKKVRKLVFSKAGANVVEEEDYESPEEMLDDNKIPRSFEFTGQIIFISNLSKDKIDPDGALRTRGYMIDINPDDDEVYDFMDKIVENIKLEDGLTLSSKERHEVVDTLREGTSKQSANFRKLTRGLNMKAGANNKGISIPNDKIVKMISRYA